MGFGDMISTLGTYKALDAWSNNLGEQTAGMGKIGFKANKTTFATTNSAHNDVGPKRANNPLKTRIGDQTLNQDSYLDFTQGALVESEGSNHFAIQGEGFFTLMDDKGKFYYTRGGDFQYKNGKVQTREGLTVVDKGMMQSLGAAGLPMLDNGVSNFGNIPGGEFVDPGTPAGIRYLNAGLTVAEVDSDNSEWYRVTNAPTGPANAGWFQHIAGTKFDEAGNYQDQAITMKTTLHFDAKPTSGLLNVAVDDWAYAYVNGHMLQLTDIIAGTDVPTTTNVFGGVPITGGWEGSTSQFDITQYLEEGINTVQLYAAEGGGGEYLEVDLTVDTSAGIQTYNAVNDADGESRWVAKSIGYSIGSQDPNQGAEQPFGNARYFEPQPGLAQEDRMFNLSAQDFFVAMIPKKDGLRYSKYGNTIYETGPEAGGVFLREGGTMGAGRVRKGMLETSNVDIDGLPGEMKMAQKMYEGMANILSARYGLIDLMFQYLIP